MVTGLGLVVAVDGSSEGGMGRSLDVLGTGMVAGVAPVTGTPAVVVGDAEASAAGAVVGAASGVAGMAVTETAIA